MANATTLTSITLNKGTFGSKMKPPGLFLEKLMLFNWVESMLGSIKPTLG
jgi:hypothetical protein